MAENEMVSITNSIDMNLSKPQETVQDRGADPVQTTGSQRVRHNLVIKEQQIKLFHLKKKSEKL